MTLPRPVTNDDLGDKKTMTTRLTDGIRPGALKLHSLFELNFN